MFLKSIEIKGFKSFADKTELSFIKGVTAVVGPNGSGKSNITDAVKWVLGEQSIKSLRGGKMEDVIFAGTQFRKPIGLAQVSLTLDNSDGRLQIDYIDVKISRRLYRSGESEYYINSTQCRLKDVQELFMDTGIGKEGYSIIGQGKIDAILSGKPEERRSLLEEAAGIVKFKSRKDEAEKKLNNTKENLLRINDILSTYEERLEPLRIENEKAKQFVKLSAQLKEKEVNVIINSITKIDCKLVLLKEELNVIVIEVKRLNLQKIKHKENLSEWSEKLEQFESAASSQKQEYYENKTRYQTLLSQSNVYLERIDNFNNLILKAKEELKIALDKLQELKTFKYENETKLKEYRNTSISTLANIENIGIEIQGLSLFIDEGSTKVDKLKSEKIELLSFISSSKNYITILNNDMETIENKVDQLETAFESYVNSIKINESTKVMLDKDINKIKDKINNFEIKIENSRKEALRLNSIIVSQQRILRELNAEYNKIEANKNMLINLEKHYEGYNKSVKILMQHVLEKRISDANDNCFVLGEVVNVKKELETAIEISLGGAISDIITSDENLAKKLINYLKINNIGRATFLPLTIIKGRTLNIDATIKHTDGYLGIASELTNYDNKYKNAVEFILGRTIIASNMESALKIAKITNYSSKIVTITGEVINPGGSLTGGSVYQKSVSIIGRKREIEELTVKLELMNKDIGNKLQELEINIKNEKGLEDKCLNLKDEIHYEYIEITKIQGKINAIEADTIKLQHNMIISKDELQDLNLNLEKDEQELNLKRESIDNLIQKEAVNDNVIEELVQLLKTKILEVAIRKDSLTTLKVKKAQIDEIFLGKQNEIIRIIKEVNEYQSKFNNMNNEIKNSELNKNDCNEKFDENAVICDTVLKSIDEMDRNFKESEGEVATIKYSIKKTSAEFEESTLILQKREDIVHRSELSITKFETELEAQYLKLNEEMELTYAEALILKVEIEDINEFKTAIVRIKSSIFELGVVNLGSIEEYEQIKEKYTFMNLQREDLNRAIYELLRVIEEMTSKMRNMFNSNFKILRENFNETFRELFKGGTADLILSAGDELTSNIEINVEPPGKKLQNINLMSGGEKVLSAISLLFAILKMKPTPFCILDEIEAALDDANVFRYAEFLRKFSKTTQFIVITHRKGTMEASDIIYGVTMEEKGVSKIVSVNLTS